MKTLSKESAVFLLGHFKNLTLNVGEDAFLDVALAFGRAKQELEEIVAEKEATTETPPSDPSQASEGVDNPETPIDPQP